MAVPQRYRKRPVTVEAMRLDSSDPVAFAQVYRWVEDHAGSFEAPARRGRRSPCPPSGVSIDPTNGDMLIATLEGLMRAKPGDWIIRGIQGEFYPCKPDIFEQTYEPAEDTP